MKGKKILFLSVFSLLTAFLSAEISFHDLNLSNDDRLLFKAEFADPQQSLRDPPRQTLFVSTLSNMSIKPLTAYPEKLQVVDNGRTVLAISRFGAVRIPTTGGLPSAIQGYPSLAEGQIPLRGRTQDFAASPDGKWILYIEPTSSAYGNMFLIDVSSGAKRIVSEKVELPASEFPAKWSPDSRLFVYSKGGRLYYLPIIGELSVLVDERFRMIGSGGINSILWGQLGDFYYLTGNTLYRVRNPELFTRTIYGDFLSIGSVSASFPFEFDPEIDRYWIAPDSSLVLISKNGRGFFIFMLGENQHISSILPHVLIPFGTENFDVLWPSPNRLAIVSERQASLWHFEINDRQVINTTSSTVSVPAFSSLAMSPDGSMIAFWGRSGLELWDFANWRPVQRIIGEPVLSCAWINNRQLVSGNEKFIEEITISGSNITSRRITLSGADEFAFEARTQGLSRILARVQNEWFATDGTSPWILVNNPQLRQVSLASERFRVFLEPQPSGHFKNLPMVRNLQSTGTVSLVSRHTANSAFVLERKTQVALCFDIYDDETGLAEVLASLRRRNIRATFFLNGDFIRRNPRAAAAIAEAGHETASLFYAPIDFSDSRYRITEDFIARGLARNEDEFNQATGKELSLLWHPPLYRSSDMINSAAVSAGYTTVTRTIDPGDWLSKEDAVRLNIRQTSASEMIDLIMQKKEANAVIPVRLGLLPGGRDDYLFQRIEVLLDALIRCGIEVVPVSAVIKR